MKKALFKDSIKEIKNTYKRFLSILLMALLGVGFFAGIRATSPDMVNTINQYYQTKYVYDIEIVSTLGLTNEDLEKLKQIEGVEEVEGAFSKDISIEMEKSESVVKIHSIGNINQVELIEGRMPEKENECLVEKSFLAQTKKEMGDMIQIQEEEEEKSFYENELEIVGVIESPLYISRERGTSKLGSGKVNYVIYVPQENVNSDFYTEVYMKIGNIEQYKTGSEDYEQQVQLVIERIEQIKEERQQARYDTLIQEANTQLEEATSELEEKRQEAYQQIDEAEQELKEAEQKIEDGEETLEENEQQVNQEFALAKEKIKEARQELEENQKQLEMQEKEALAGFAQAEALKQEQQQNLENITTAIEKTNLEYEKIVQQLENTEELTEEKIQELQIQKQTLEQTLKQLEQNRLLLTQAISQIETEIAQGEEKIENGKKQIEQGNEEIDKQEQTLIAKEKQTNTELESAKKELESSKKEIEEGYQTLEEKKQEMEEQLEEAEGKLIDAKQEIEEIEHPTWYVLDRNSNSGYHSFIQDTQNIENIGKVFPVVFFVVATLISLTSMTRMVEEQRVQIGTLKALGYNKIQIASKYILYATLATVIGGILGMAIGFPLLPRIIWMMYAMMYTMPDIAIEFNTLYATTGLLLAVICIVGATMYSITKELRATPAELMRPKSPKMGKRVLLEKVPFIWKKLSFSNKVTVRNIFRYKKRFLMTIIGILGCTSLVLAGFGLKDSISKILPNQYENVFEYDMAISLKSGLEESQLQELEEGLNEKKQIEQTTQVFMSAGVLKKEDKEEEVQIIVPENEQELEEFIHLSDIKTKEKIELDDNTIVITDKVAELLGVKQGDTIMLQDKEEEEREVTIGSLTPNYISHYVYMTKSLYEILYGEGHTNVILTKNQELTEEQEEALSKEILLDNKVSSISLTSTAITAMDDTMSSLNYVVWILIISSGLLAFVVLYNLSNVNISERIRELATIKVLGFYDKEVYDYVTKETIILTAIGIILGLIGGYFLNFFIIKTCELNVLKFTTEIDTISYCYAAGITILFTMIVNFVTYFVLKKINMIESLKSVE